MPRPERAIAGAGLVESFATGLREVRERAGAPGYRELADRTGFSRGTLAEAAAGRRLPTLAVALAYVRACDGDVEEWERRWREVAEALAARPNGHAPAPRDATGPVDGDGAVAPVSPYRGLTGYGVDDARFFFGRRRVVRQLLALLGEHRLVAVFGVSGSGKSSLLRAGLEPALRGAESPDEATGIGPAAPVWLTPGARPLAALRAALDSAPADRDPVLIVDQFEEIFTLCRDPADRAALVAELAALVADPAGRVRVVLAVRADFYPRCAEIPGLAELMAGASLAVPPLTEDELREVVTGPARVAGLTVERALVVKVLADAVGQPGALPLISHALLETWRLRRTDVLTVAGYEAAGGVAGAIAKTAEAVYDRFDAVQRETARAVLIRLVNLGDGSEGTRRRVDRDELDLPRVDAVLEAFAQARLVTLGRGTVELAHEALIRTWPRLSGWLQEDRAALLRHRQLTEAAQVWRSLKDDPGALYRGALLAAWEDGPVERLTEVESRFLASSREQERRRQAARWRRRRLAVASLAAATVVMTVLAAVAVVQADRAAGDRDLARAEKLAAEARAELPLDPQLALRLASGGEDLRSTEQTQAVLRQAVQDSRVRAVRADHRSPVRTVAYSPDGRRAASGGADGTVLVWTLGPDGLPAGGPAALHAGPGGVRQVAFGPGARLVSVGDDGGARLWDLAGGAAPAALPGGRRAVAFSPDGRTVASPGTGGTVLLFDVAAPATPRVLRVGGDPSAVAFTPDGRGLAVGDAAGSVSIWPLAGPRKPIVLYRGTGYPVTGIAVSSDGRLVTAAGEDGATRVWDTGRGGEPTLRRGHDGVVTGVAFSRDGRRLATAGQDGMVWVWNTGSTVYPMALRGHKGGVRAVAFSPDSTRLATAGEDGTLRFWEASPAGELRTFDGHSAAAWIPAISPDGRLLATAGEDGTVRIRPLAGDAAPIVLRGHTGDATSVAFSADGRRVVSAGIDGTVRVWPVGGGAPTVLRGHAGFAWWAVFTADGRAVLSTGSDGTIRRWPLDGGAGPVVLGRHEGSVRQIALGPDGRRLASGGRVDGTVRLWTLDGGAPLVLRGHEGAVRTVAFSPDGRYVASGGNDGTVRVWPVAGGDPTVLRGHQGVVWSVAFSPDGQWIAASGYDGTVRFWPASGGEPVAYQGFGVSVEGVVFAPDGRLVTAHGDGTVRIWRCEVCAPIERVRELAGSRTLV